MYLAVSSVGFTVCLISLFQTIINRQTERQTRRFFAAIFSVLVGYFGSYLLAELVTGHTGDFWLFVLILTFCLKTVFASALLFLTIALLLYQTGEKHWWRCKSLYFVGVSIVLYIALFGVAQFCPELYSIDEQNVFHRGQYYPVLLIPPLVVILAGLAIYWHRRKRLNEKQRTAFFIYLFAPLVGILLQLVSDGIFFMIAGVAVGATVMSVYLLRVQSERAARQEKENAELRMKIMLSQIQPHFLYNSLGAIGRMCRNDPEAKAAIFKFAHYLRGNMDSLSQTAPVPFEKELEHTSIYLELEQMRFGSDLKVEYKLECTDFLIPTLTLQPIAENAVRHGVRGNEDGAGTVTIATHEREDCYEITVSDDGPGFDPETTPSNRRSHVGLENVRERIRESCGGSLWVETAPGHGCRVILELPKEN